MAKPTSKATRKGKSTKRRPKAKLCGDLAKRGMSDLNGVIDFLSRQRDLVRVKSEVDPCFELGGVADKLHGGKPVLFERIKSSPWPVFGGLYWNRPVLADMFGMPETRLSFHIAEAVAEWRAAPVHPVVVDSAPCQEVVDENFDIRNLPVPQVGTEEGGQYLTACVIIAKDPDTGVRNASIMRCMITGRDRMTAVT
jgi:2,5-furandicarboxylate decarboxylase 1